MTNSIIKSILIMSQQRCLFTFFLLSSAVFCEVNSGRASSKQIFEKLIDMNADLNDKIDGIASKLLDLEKKENPTCPVPCQPVCQPNEMCFNLDATGAITGHIPGVSIVSPMTLPIDDKPCSRQIVLKCEAGAACSAIFESGDGATQSYDSEIHGRNQNIEVHGNDHCIGISSNHPDALEQPASLVNVWVRNSYVKIANDNGLVSSNCSSCLFALGGQLDDEGPENEDIFIAANRVINTPPGDRVGNGLCFMKLRWVSGSNE
ncbi:uncharacterized protein LOC132715412 [Ruditapes philippinarum]|uniref:uncharacterized protein LOC132715412 n=1 Tax=Ruditapes philippinarum TaxID=129788 RepID=UPI00295B4DC5|nr:uncharacterized protein LOC132715412 [Ruditapes philippinarum]